MMICCGRAPSRSAVSLRHFIKHLPLTKPPTRLSIKFNLYCSAGLASGAKLSHYESLSARQKDQISLYVDSLLEWNQKMNLTAVREVEDVMERHVEDSLAIIPPIQDSYSSYCNGSCDKLNVVDVGTGAGLPGIILAIACPDWNVTLMESMNKRCIFLEHAVEVTGISNAKVVRGRAENLGQNQEYREFYDVAVARAVAEMRILVEYCLPLVRLGGLFVAAKGHDPKEEITNAERALQIMGASVVKLYSVDSHSPHGQRTAIVCLKGHSTPNKYPRDPGTPAKLPL
uniref:Ribosomal RNA small subunit methyltransferase G n=1 Tax=Kalanchoe fedtschenkoi TaxID=63787 RepID=A0A7N0VKB6_KALFE